MNTQSNTQYHADQETLTDEEFERICNFGPSISDEQMSEIERAANDESLGMQRRLVLAACATSAEVLSNIYLTEPEAFAEMLNSIEAFKEYAKGLVDFSEAAYFRMLSASCRGEAQTEANQE